MWNSCISFKSFHKPFASPTAFSPVCSPPDMSLTCLWIIHPVTALHQISTINCYILCTNAFFIHVFFFLFKIKIGS